MPNKSTRFYKHYKNKPYRLIGTVRHSETLEEMALYETLYENNNGRLWVRPKEMFFENVTIDGVSRPRFEKINFKFETLSSINESQKKEINSIYQTCFQKNLGIKFESTINSNSCPNYILAYEGEKLVGFKLGYARNADHFYSWLGGVLPDYRGLGLASVLMETQHEWCKSEGFKRIETRTRNQFTSMISLNLKFGFKVVGTIAYEGDSIKIIMEKVL